MMHDMPVLVLVLLAIIALLVIGSVVLGLALKLLWWALIGLFIGALARAVLPGRQAIGLLRTAGAGVGGSLLGGVVANAANLGGFLQFVIAVAAAAVLVPVLGATRDGGGHDTRLARR